ncbi:MAG: hypothetical protein COA79_08865 [Planctomycetota bacterium]|nr:MAG: hypothetical protein COA79_08865 [Planctomycetota bacterium]
MVVRTFLIFLPLLLILSFTCSAKDKEWLKLKKEFLLKIQDENIDTAVSAYDLLKDRKDLKTVKLAMIGFKRKEIEIFEVAAKYLQENKESEEAALWILKSGIRQIKDIYAMSYIFNSLGHFKFPAVVLKINNYLKRARTAETLIPLVEAAGMLQDSSSLPHLFKIRKNGLYRVHYGLRKTLFEALIEFPAKEVVPFLIKVLYESQGVIGDQIQQYLSIVTGTVKGDSKKWQIWLEENKDNFSYREFNAQKKDELLGRTWATDKEGVTYYEIPINAKRIVFVVDQSGSMSIGNSENTRMDRAIEEIKAVVGKLPKGYLFEVVAFSTKASVWFRKLAGVGSKTKIAFDKRMRGLKAGGGTNTFDAFKKAFETDRNTEAIFFMSDGNPSVGKIISQTALLAHIKKENRFRKIDINAIGLVFGDIPEKFLKAGYRENVPELEKFMKNVALQNNGKYKMMKK